MTPTTIKRILIFLNDTNKIVLLGSNLVKGIIRKGKD